MPRSPSVFRALAAACVVAASSLFAVAPTHAASAQEQLTSFSRDIRSASGSFTQSTRSADGKAGTPQTGTFAFERPGRFKWAVNKPYEQLVLADGKQLFQYDPDLAQVTVRPMDAALGTSPAQVLFGTASLEKTFTLAPLPDRDGLNWLRATPRSADAGFAHMDIGFDGNLPMQIQILDGFGQLTEVVFNSLVPNPTLGADTFRFVPPQGVDVVKM